MITRIINELPRQPKGFVFRTGRTAPVDPGRTRYHASRKALCFGLEPAMQNGATASVRLSRQPKGFVFRTWLRTLSISGLGRYHASRKALCFGLPPIDVRPCGLTLPRQPKGFVFRTSSRSLDRQARSSYHASRKALCFGLYPSNVREAGSCVTTLTSTYECIRRYWNQRARCSSSEVTPRVPCQ